ncbi:MAG: 50S ribosomal protein L23 [Coleofasciculus sp. C2-GNP5-27]
MSTANQERLLNVIRAPHISEKTSMAGEQDNQYVFKVAVDATKPEIKAAVESVFSVSVEQVRVVNMKGKVRRTRNGLGRRNDWKKAYVSLAEGQQIDFTAAI